MTNFRKAAGKYAAIALTTLMVSPFIISAGHAEDSIQIGLSTKAWFPSFIATLAQEQGYFKEEDVKAELTVYQSGSEALTAIAAGAANLISTNPSIVMRGRAAGVDSKLVSLLATRNYGWQIMVGLESTLADVKGLSDKKVGITSAGSATDLLANWAMTTNGVKFTTVPLGGGGLVPNLLSGNVDAVVVYPPLSYKVVLEGSGKTLIDFGKKMPAHLEAGWAANDAYISEHPGAINKALKAMYRGVAFIKNNPDKAIPMLAKYNGISEAVAKQEYESTFLNLSDDGAMTLPLVKEGLSLFGSGKPGKKKVDPSEIFTQEFTPVKISK